MLNLAKKLPDDWQIAIAGEGLPDDMASFERLIKANEVADKIIYRGGLHDEELAEHYRQASISSPHRVGKACPWYWSRR